MIRVADILCNFNVVGFGSEELKQLKGEGKKLIAITTEQPTQLVQEGITLFAIPYQFDEQVLEDAAADVFKILAVETNDQVTAAPQEKLLVVSAQPEVVDYLKNYFPNAIFTGTDALHKISNEHVIGEVPPYLIHLCESYQHVEVVDNEVVIHPPIKVVQQYLPVSGISPFYKKVETKKYVISNDMQKEIHACLKALFSEFVRAITSTKTNYSEPKFIDYGDVLKFSVTGPKKTTLHFTLNFSEQPLEYQNVFIRYIKEKTNDHKDELIRFVYKDFAQKIMDTVYEFEFGLGCETSIEQLPDLACEDALTSDLTHFENVYHYYFKYSGD